jgi:hypothetical protein
LEQGDFRLLQEVSIADWVLLVFRMGAVRRQIQRNAGRLVNSQELGQLTGCNLTHHNSVSHEKAKVHGCYENSKFVG